MADTIPGVSPILQSALTKLGATPEMDTAHKTKAAFDGLSRKTKVPANVLMALDEADGGRGDIAKAEANAMRFSQAMAQGGSLDDAMLAYAGGDSDRAKALMDRSYDIADAIYPQRTPPVEEGGSSLLGRTAGFVADTGKALVGRGVQAAGGIPRAAGVALDEGLKRAIENFGGRDVGEDRGEKVEGETFLRPAGRIAGDAVQAGGEAILGTMSDAGKESMAGFSPSGELFSPGTWDMGKDPSLGGAILNIAGGVGSMIPMLATRNPYVAALTGGLMAGGEGAANGRQFVIDAAATMDEGGQPEIAKLPEYQKLIGDGRSHDQATMELARRAESEAGFRQGIFGALGGAATNRIFRSADGWLGNGGRLARATKKGAAGFIEEGTQEALEGVASQSGIEAATGAAVNLAEDSFGNFLMGGLTGAGAGAGGGILFGNGEREDDAPEADQGPDALPGPDRPLLLPPPDGGSMGATRQLPAPEDGGTIFGGGRPGTPPTDFERNVGGGPRPRPEDIRSQPAELRRGPDPASVQPSPDAPISMGATPDAPPLALPAPNNGGTIFGGGRPGTAPGEVERNPASLPRPTNFAPQPANLRPGQNAPADGSGGSMVVAPDQAALSATGATTPTPAGPIEALARSIQLPEPAPVEAPPPLRFPEQKVGAAIRLGDPENGQIFDAVFMGETPNGARVRIAGQEVDLTPEEFDMGRDAVAQIEAVQKAQAEAEKAAQKAGAQQNGNQQNAQQKQGQGAVPGGAGNRPTSRTPRIEDTTRARDQDLMARLDFLAGQARLSGWNTVTTRERTQIEAELAARNPAPVEDDALIDAADQPNTPAPHKRPFINYVGRRFGGINPTGKVAEELRHRGVTSKTAPGLFRRSGHKDLDNLPASDHPELTGAIHADEMTGYLNPQSIIDAIVDEVAGTPLAFGRHVTDQQNARDAQATARENRIGRRAPAPSMDEVSGIPPRDMDIRTDSEREADILSAVSDEINDLGLDSVLTPSDRTAIVDVLDREGGDVADAIYEYVIRSAGNGIRETAGDGSAADALADIPFGDDGEGFTGNRPGVEGRTSAESEDPFGPEPSEGNDRDPAARDESLSQTGAEAAPAEKPAPAADRSAKGVQWLRDRATHDPKQDEDITVTEEMAEEDGIEPGIYRARTFTFRGELPAPMRAALRGVGDNTDFARTEYFRYGADRNTRNRIEYSRIERERIGDLPAAEVEAAPQPAAPQVTDVSPETYRSWRNGVPFSGSLRGWTVFDDTQIGGSWVLMSTDMRAGPFETEQAARAWAKDNPESGFGSVIDGENPAPAATPASEAGAEGKPQTVIPGAERSEAQAQQASADRAQLEMQARQQQSKIRRQGGNSGDAGPLFDTQADMFGGAGPSAVNAPGPKAAEPSGEVVADMDLVRRAFKAAGIDIVLKRDGTVQYRDPRKMGGGLSRIGWDSEFRVGPDGTLRHTAKDPVAERAFGKWNADLGKATEAAAQADPEPSEAQKEAGNYRKGHMSWNGLDLTIENAKGSTRSGKDSKGNEWSVTMPAHYGYFKGTEGADGDHVDFYMGDVESSDYVLIVDQVHADTGKFDEHKVIIGTTARGAALDLYREGFADGRGDDRIGAITEINVATLKNWLAGGDTSKPIGNLTHPFRRTQAQPKFDTAADWSGAVLDAARRRLSDGNSVMVRVGRSRTVMLSKRDDLEGFRVGADGQIQMRAGNRWDSMGITEADALAAQLDLPPLFEAVPPVEREETPSVADQIDAIADERGIEITEDQRGQVIAGQRDGESVADAFERIVSDTGERLLRRGRAILLQHTNADDGPFDAAAGMDLRDTPEGIAFADRLAKARDMAERKNLSDQWVREQGQKTGIEYLVALDADGVPLALMSGHVTGVSAHASVFRAAEAGLIAYTTHNHPASSGFSGSDVAMMHAGFGTVVAVGHDGSRHEMSPRQDVRIKDRNEMGVADILPMRDNVFDPIMTRGHTEANHAAWALPGSQDEQIAAWRKAVNPLFGLILDRMGVISYIGGTVEDVTAAGFNFEEIYGQVSKFGRDRLRRAGFAIPEEGSGTGDPAPSDKPRSRARGRAGADQQAAADGEKRNGQGRVPSEAVTAPATGKIEDFGQKLGGARKDTWTAYADRMADAERVDVAAEPLSKSWPAPDYEKLIADGVEPWKVDLIRVTRDAIPTKPQSSWKLKGWVENVTLLRDFANKIMDGRYERADIKRMMGANNKIMGQLDLYEVFGHGQSLKGIHLSAGSYSMYGGVRYSPNKVIWEVSVKAKATAFSNMPKTLAKGDTKEEAIEAFKKIYDSLGSKTDKASKGPKFLIYGHDGRKYFTVGVKIGSNYIQLRRTDDVKEARRIIAEESEALADQLAKMREIPADRRAENAPRVGIDHRMGADITPEQFGEAFGFRGVEFGNWVEGKRRQQDLNNAYDALMDLAGILDIPAKAISLNGSLGLAFGARGTGGVSPAAAHYEPGKVVINLTKMQGAGSLAHEWFHALDNYFGKTVESRMGKPGALTYVSDNITPGRHVAGVRPEVIDAFIALRQAIGKTKLKERSSNIDKMRHKPYWGKGIEMHARAFESYAIAKLQDQSGSNDYLVNTVNGESWAMQAELSGLGDSYPYLKDDEIEVVRPAFDALFETMANRETDQGIELYQRDMGKGRSPVADLTGQEIGEASDIRDLGKKAYAWYRENLIGGTVTMRETGWLVRFSRRGANKISGRKGEDLLRIVPAIPQIIESGRLIASEPNRKEGGIAAYHKVAGRVLLNGEVKDVVVTLRETRDGHYHYDLSRDTDEDALFSRPSSPVIEAGARGESGPSRVAPAILNIASDNRSFNGGVSLAALAETAKTVSAILKAHGIDRKVSPRVVRGLSSAAGVPVLGSYRGGEFKVNADAANPAHVARHEIIHALRDKGLWGSDYGLFSQAEWQALAKAARANRAIREAVEIAYPDLTTAQQTEEMIAEMYADWATNRASNTPGALARALERIRSMFRAMAAALRGEGFVDAAGVMRRIANGEIGARGPEGGPGGGMIRNEKADAWLRSRGRQLPKDMETGHRRSQKILQHRDVFNSNEAAKDQRGPAQDETAEIAAEILAALEAESPNWTSGRHFENVASRLMAEDASLIESHSEIGRARYDFDTRTFRNGQGQPLSDETLDEWSDVKGRIRAARAGRRSLKRNILFNTLLRAEGGQRPRLLEQALRWQPENVLKDGIDGILYQRTSKRAEASDAVRGRIAAARVGRSDGLGAAGTAESKDQRDLSALKARLSKSKGKALGMAGSLHWKRTPQALSGIFSNLLTDAMGRNERFNLLGAVPGRPLFAELGKNLAAAQEYLGLKEQMDAERNEWQSLSAETVDKWSAAARKHPDANARLMELMHDTTISQIDPSRADGWTHPVDKEAAEVLKMKAASKERKEWAEGVLKDAEARKAAYPAFKARFDRLPKPMRDMYEEVRDTYSKLADAEEEAVMENIKQGIKAALEQARRDHRKERQRINDEMVPGEARTEALGKANKRLTEAEARAARSTGPWLRQLRQVFESNRIAGPYFPLTRQGEYFVAVRDQEGNLIEFQRFETADAQGKFAAEQAKNPDLRVRRGVVDNGAEIREAADPRFVADVEKLLSETGASKEAMDAVWQKYLETMPGQSMRKNRIHRKGTRGYNADAMRAFASGMFHGSHQVARLRYGTQMTEALAVAKEQAAEQKDPNRAGFVVREMEKRHAFAMNPTNNPLVTAGTSAAFVWYLAASPAAALVNVSQTTVVGVPLMRAHYKKAGTDGVIRALTKASRDFVKGRGKVTKRVAGIPVMSETWSIENAPDLTADERKAMAEGYERGVIDKTQAHDLAAVAESGVTYNPTREKVMRILGWGFHHTERFNREVTYLASYRLARDQGMSHDEATRDAGRVTWNVHFDYSNTSRPRIMQGDAAKLILIFRNFSVNMLYRLFRDTHQALNGADAETRKEARNQLIGVTLSMMTHAGIRGVWGYGILMMMLGVFFPGGGDDADEWLQDVLLMEGDDIGTAAWNWTMGLALNGVPGHAMGMNLTERIGMPNLWFRGSDRDLEGSDLWAHYMGEMAGPLFSIPGNALIGAGQMLDGHYLRGLEKMTPVFARNPIKTARYLNEGVTTVNGDPLVDGLNPWQVFVQANGFTPAEVAERYKINSRLKNNERRVEDRRRGIIREIGDAVRAGQDIPEQAIEKMRGFNMDYPEWAITADTIRRSVRSRERASQRQEYGASLNPKLNDRLRGEAAPALYN